MDRVLADLHAARSAHAAAASPSRPFVLLTWAQSADGYISTSRSSQTHISCSESAAMTQALRAANDTILVGVQTVLTDNPRLNTRIDGRPPDPRPAAVVLDTRLRTPGDAKLVATRRGSGVQVLIYCGNSPRVGKDEKDNSMWVAEEEHVERVSVGTSRDGKVDLGEVLSDLHERGYQGVMVEGGSQVLSSFLESGLCDFVVVTIAPVFLGCGVAGIACAEPSGRGPLVLPSLVDLNWRQIGSDIVLSGRLEKQGR